MTLMRLYCGASLVRQFDRVPVPPKVNSILEPSDAGFFKQEGEFTIEGNKIRTKGLGNYRVVSIEGFEMVLNYDGFMFFTKGACS